MGTRGVPARELSDAELERQGAQAHLTRNRVFLHGTAEQFRYHTERMLELEQEYLRRHPKRTWQGSEGAEPVDLGEANKIAQVSSLFESFVAQMRVLLADTPAEPQANVIAAAAKELLAAFAAAEDGRMHKLEAHQKARELGASPGEVAALYRHEPPLLATAGGYRVITDAGRESLSSEA